MGISATDPIGPALNRTGRMLFKPFDAGKWFTLGFCAFLATLGEGGGGNFNFSGGGGGGGGGPAPGPLPTPGPLPGPRPPPFPTPGPGRTGTPDPWPDWVSLAWDFFLRHAFWIVPAALAAIALIVVLMWVRARGKFLFLEGVAYDRAAVVEPWKRLRPLANSYFRFELLMTVLALAATTLLAAIVLLIALPDIRSQQMGGPALTAIVIGGAVLAVGAVGFALVHAAAHDFVIPLMYLRGQMIGPAWREFRQHILAGNVGAVVVFYLMRIVLGIASAMIMGLGTCLTCCIAGLPYLSSVVFLPIFVFNRAYSLHFLRQFGYQYNLLIDLPEPPAAAFPVIMPAQGQAEGGGRPPPPAPPPPPPPDPPGPPRDI